jgi:hypothetical protein
MPVELRDYKTPLDKIQQNIDVMIKNSHGLGDNPYTVNLITCNIHGFLYGNDTIGVLPVK